jgi:GT2 family glycosyltransferase
MNYPTVDIITVTYNSFSDMKKYFEGIKEINYPKNKLKLYIRDNASMDNTVEIVKNESAGIKKSITTNKDNVGFSKGNNQAIEKSNAKYILFLNPDTYITKDCIRILVDFLEKNKEYGFAGGKLLKLDGTIDSAGILLTKNRKFADRGIGKKDTKEFNKEEDIFAICGAGLLCKRRMLEDIKVMEEYFDEDFFAYYEDIDLCWRAGKMGWKGKYIPKAVIYHKRGHDLEPFTLRRWTSHTKKRRAYIKNDKIKIGRRLLFRNSILILFKEEELSTLLKNSIPILGRLIGRLAYIALFEGYLLKEVSTIADLIPVMIEKRKEINMKKNERSIDS